MEVVIFTVGQQEYAVPITAVMEVQAWTQPTPVPDAPPIVEGVIDLRGEVMPVVDIRKRLGLPVRPADAETLALILDAGGLTAALTVDGVDQVVTLTDDQISPPESRMTLPGQDYVVGVARSDDRLIILMDLSRLLTAAESR